MQALARTAQGLPPMTRITIPTCRAHYPGGTERVQLSIASPSHAAFPGLPAGRLPRRTFRGLLGLHTRYGLLDRSTAQGGLCREAPIRRLPGQIARQLPEQIDNSLGGISLHWCSAPSGRTAIRLKYDTNLDGYVTGITEGQIKDAPEFSDDSYGDRNAEKRVYSHYNASTSWGL